MITYNPELIKIPAFLTKFIDLDNLSVIQKIRLMIKGKIIAYCLKNFSESAICKVLNRTLKFDGEVEYKEKFYIKNINGTMRKFRVMPNGQWRWIKMTRAGRN